MRPSPDAASPWVRIRIGTIAGTAVAALTPVAGVGTVIGDPASVAESHAGTIRIRVTRGAFIGLSPGA
jgi:hypothetical protein